MSVRPPNPVGGTGKDAQWFNQLLAYAKSLELKSVYNGLLKRGPDGTKIEAKGGNGIAAEPTTLKKFYYQSSQSNYLWCTDVELPAAAGVVPVYTPVAKSTKLRNAIVSEVIDDVTVNYAYIAYTTDGQKFLRRDASIGSSIEKQVIVPRFLKNDPIYAMKSDPGAGMNTVVADTSGFAPVGTAIEYTDMNIDARAWAAKADQST